MNLHDIVDDGGITWAQERGLVSVQEHPALPLSIANYTHRCQFDRAWNQVTINCRGLIWDRRTGEVLARPFTKFFNAGEHGERMDGSDEPGLVTLDPDEPATVYDKLDGSLGILYPQAELGNYAIATRGSFTSEQALHATAVWRQRYGRGEVRIRPNTTWLFEIVYPANRVVVDYSQTDDLVLLAVLDNETHEDLTEKTYWPGPRAESFGVMTLRRVLELPPRPNAEGVVLSYRRQGGDMRVKVKQDDYVRLHRIVTGLNEKTVWEAGRDGAVDLAAGLPDEFAAFVLETNRRLWLEAEGLKRSAEFEHRTILQRMPTDQSLDDRALRAAYAKMVIESRSPDKDLLFRLWDGRDITDICWRLVKPAAERPFRELSEAVA